MITPTEVTVVQALSVVTNIGAAIAVIVVVMLFLKFNRERDDLWREFFIDLNKSYVEGIQGLTKSVSQLLECQSEDRETYTQILSNVLLEIKVHEARTVKRIRNLHNSLTKRGTRRSLANEDDDIME